MPKRKCIPDDFSYAVARYINMDCSTTDLAKTYNVSKATILKWMDSMGISRYPAKNLISIKMKGRVSGAKGAKRTEEQKRKMSEARKHNMPTTLGYKFTQESKNKMSASAKRRMSNPDNRNKLRNGLDKWLKENRLSDSEKIARCKSRAACKRMLRRILTMSRKRKDKKTEDMLGYTKEQLRNHLQSKFSSEMSWEKRNSFHIDHIKPVAAFFSEGIYDPAIINSLDNLQVLTPEENMRKSDIYNGYERKQALIIDRNGTRGYA